MKILFKFILDNVVTIAGFLVSYFLLSRSFRQEVEKQKSGITLNMIEEIPLLIQDSFSLLGDKQIGQQERFNAYKKMLNRILAYGSKESVKIATAMVSHSRDTERKSGDLTILAFYALLFCSIKFDLSGIEITPASWYLMNINDYHKTKSELNIVTNQIIVDFNLPKFLKCE